MTKEIAIHRLLLVRHRKDNTDLLNEALDMAIEALRKQIPLDYKISEDGDALCPICGADAEWHKYCEECGQALKWKDESD